MSHDCALASVAIATENIAKIVRNVISSLTFLRHEFLPQRMAIRQFLPTWVSGCVRVRCILRLAWVACNPFDIFTDIRQMTALSRLRLRV